MRILVISDSHGDEHSLALAVLAQPGASLIVHLGDGERDMDNVAAQFPAMEIVQVRGNGDIASLAELTVVKTAGDKRLFCAHGDTFGVKNGGGGLEKAAKKAGADIVLYGHTHEPVTRFQDGIHYMNPGSIRLGSYGVVDITKAGVVTVLMKI